MCTPFWSKKVPRLECGKFIHESPFDPSSELEKPCAISDIEDSDNSASL